MSSGVSLRYTSRPLHSGQTRISSSFGSTPVIEFLGEPRGERGIGLRAYRQHPPVGPRNAAQFYRVLLGEQHRRVVAEVQIAGDEAVMIREWMRYDLESRVAQMEKKPLRIADSGGRMHAFEAGELHALPRICHAMRRIALQLELRHNGIHAAQASLRLTQRPRGQEKAVAEAACIDYGDLEVAAHRVMLQPVVEHEDVDLGVLRAQRSRHARAIRADPNRAAAAPREDDRLVANLRSVR